MKKKIALFLMLAVAMFSLSGCDTDDDADTAYFFEAYSDNVRMLMKAYDYETGDVIGTAELYKIDNWYDNWYDNSYWSKPNTLQGSKEE